jgi:hypothetical protein
MRRKDRILDVRRLEGVCLLLWCSLHQGLTMADISKFSSEKSRLARIADPKPLRWIPGTSPDTNHSMRALTTRRNKPRVRMVKGKVRITMTGFTKKLTKPKTIAPINADPQPSTDNPETSLETTRRRAALIIKRARSSTINQLLPQPKIEEEFHEKETVRHFFVY